MAAYYNENDPKTAAWLRELIKTGLIADGEVDTRSILDFRPGDVRGFAQCHFFAGIGGWSYALRLAGWPDERECWTGSCPCQPFSSAGAQAGGHDPRDLWPTWFQLVKECRPLVIFGEQVEAAIGHGWLDRLCDDLEAEDYAIGAAGLPSASVGAFDIRQRLWFVGELADTDGFVESHGELQRSGGLLQSQENTAVGVAVADDSITRLERAFRASLQGRDERFTRSGELGYADGPRQQGGTVQAIQRTRRREEGTETGQSGCAFAGVMGESDSKRETTKRRLSGRAGVERSRSPWAEADWIPCRDGKVRPVEPGTFPLAHGVPARVGRLRGYGNAINPHVAAEFIAAYWEVSRNGSMEVK